MTVRMSRFTISVDERKVVPRMSQEGLEATFEEDGRPPVLVAHLTVTVTEILGARNLGGRGGGVGRSAAARPLLADEMDEKKKRVPMTPVLRLLMPAVAVVRPQGHRIQRVSWGCG